ncbi:MAG: hypothetical protein V4631_16700 [Pseudomonadota bacterium]
MSDNTFERWGGNVMCVAGILFVGAALLSFIPWGWGLFGFLLFVVGWYMRRSARDDRKYGVVDIVDGATDLFDFDLTDID